MKINIITQPLFCNYGGILQNYALQEVLRRMGHDVLTVNVPPRDISPQVSWKDYIHTIINFCRRILGQYDCPFLNPHTFAKKERELSEPQRDFIRKHIVKVDCKTPFTKNTSLYHTADMWIVGSDQTWRPWCSPDICNYFFDFLDEATPRIAYAVSFGTDQWEISPELTSKVAELVLRFKAISVREISGVSLCKNYLNVDASHVLDPTMLLTGDDYLMLTNDNDYPHCRYIATYILDPDKIKKRSIKKESKISGLEVVPIGVMHRSRFDSIETWLATIAHADKVITDSFHGVVFSLIFGRPVKFLGNSVRGNARLDSLVASLKLVKNIDGYIILDCDNKAMLETLKAQSFDFIDKNLR